MSPTASECERVLVTGSQGWTDRTAIRAKLTTLPDGSVVIHGGADGADQIAGEEAEKLGLWVVEVACRRVHWRKYRGSAGTKRNRVMLDLAPGRVLGFTLGTPGTFDTLHEAHWRRIPLDVTRDPERCPRDTNGDGDCAEHMCPLCGGGRW